MTNKMAYRVEIDQKAGTGNGAKEKTCAIKSSWLPFVITWLHEQDKYLVRRGPHLTLKLVLLCI